MNFVLLLCGTILVTLAVVGFVRDRRGDIQPNTWLHIFNIVLGLGATIGALIQFGLSK